MTKARERREEVGEEAGEVMPTLNYRRKPPDRPRLLTRPEFIIVLTGAAVLTAIIIGAVWFFFRQLDFAQM